MTTETEVATQDAPQPAPEAKEVPSAAEAVEKAFAAVEAEAEKAPNETEDAARVLRGEPDPQEAPAAKKQTKSEPKSDAAKDKKDDKPAQDRDEGGKFKAKEAKADAKEDAPDKGQEATTTKAPSRFSKDAQAEWDKAPESVRKEVERALSELEDGLGKHKGTSEKYARFEAAAQQAGMTVEYALNDYINMSHLLRSQGPVAVLDALGKQHGFTSEDVAQQIIDVDMNDYATRTNKQIKDLQSQLAQSQQKLALASQELSGFRQRQQSESTNLVKEFAENNPRFKELQPDIKYWLSSNHEQNAGPMEGRLQWAYDQAARLNPVEVMTTPTPADTATPKTDLDAQTVKAAKSISGAPAAGSNPVNRKPASNASEAVDRAFAAAGL